MKQTAVKWLEEQLINNKELISLDFQQAKEMEKNQLEQFYNHGKWAIIEHGHGEEFIDYYQTTFKSE